MEKIELENKDLDYKVITLENKIEKAPKVTKKQKEFVSEETIVTF